MSKYFSKTIFMSRIIYEYIIMNGRQVSFEQKRKDFQLIEYYGLRGVIAWLQSRRLYGLKGFVAGRPLPESLKSKPFIFVISFHKNGTRSIHTYLEKLGLRGMHWPVFMTTSIDYEYILRPIAHDPKQCIEALIPLLNEYDFFNDVPFPGLFQELAEIFPKSKFILTQRPPQEWGESIWRHWRKFDPGTHPYHLSVFEAIQYHVPVGTTVTEADQGDLIEKYVTHNETVQTYFAGTERLLIADLSDPKLNIRISEFLGLANTPSFPKIREGAV